MKTLFNHFLAAALLAACITPASRAQNIDNLPTITGSAVDKTNDKILIRDASVDASAGALRKMAIGEIVNVPGLFSTTGGANSILKANGDGDFTTGNFTNAHDIMGDGGNMFFPDTRGIGWLRQDGTGPASFITMNQNHDGQGGELYIQSPWRIAMLAYGPIQIGVNDNIRYPVNLHLTTGEPTSTDTIKESYPILFGSKTWNGGDPARVNMGMQAVPTQANGVNPVLKIFSNALETGYDGGSGGTTIGKLTGDLAAEIGKDGINSPGIAPAYSNLTDGATITLDCNKYKDTQAFKVTLGGNRTLAFTNQLPGMRGIIYVQQDATGSRTLTLPNGSATASGWALSTAAYTVDRLYWDYDGTYIYWTMSKGLVLPTDTDAAAFFTRASITDPTQQTAVNNLVLSLKGAGLWTKLDCIYPFVGGNATAHSKNLKADAYNLTWYGTVTHNSSGVTGNGSTGWGSTGYAFGSLSQRDDAFGSVYCKTAAPTVGGYLFGTSPDNSRFGMYRDSGGAVLWVDGPHLDSHGGAGNFPTSSDFRLHMYISRYSSTAFTWGSAGTPMTFDSERTFTATNASTVPVGILARAVTSSTASDFTNANLAFAAFGRSLGSNTTLTASQWAVYHAIVTTYETTLGRQN